MPLPANDNPEPRPLYKVKVKNRAKSPRGFSVHGKMVMVEPGEEAELELDEGMVETLRASSEAGGDVELLHASQPRATMKKG